jgi:hypothetical protein
VDAGIPAGIKYIIVSFGRRHVGPKLLGTPVVRYKLRVPVWERKDE